MRIKKLSIKMYNNIKKFYSNKAKYSTKPYYRVIEISQNKDSDYLALIQVINKNFLFKAKPEDILSQDYLVDRFSPRDIRTLTYLGYLGMNSPKYKILAKRLSDNEDCFLFTLKEKHTSTVVIKTADQIISEKNIIDGMAPEDAKVVGYVSASDSLKRELKQKQELLKQLEATSSE